MKSVVADCGHRERAGMIDDGECRSCRGDRPERVRARTRRSHPGDEAADLRHDANRQRILLNDRGPESDR